MSKKEFYLSYLIFLRQPLHAYPSSHMCEKCLPVLTLFVLVISVIYNLLENVGAETGMNDVPHMYLVSVNYAILFIYTTF